MFNEGTSTPRTRGRALRGLVVALVLIAASTLSLNVYGLNLTFTAIPIIAVFLWPRGADPSLSVICLFLCGIVHDMVSFGLIGFWPLLYLLYFIIFRPDGRRKEETFWVRWGKLLLIAVFGGCVIWLVGTFVMQIPPDLKSLAIMQGVVVFLFPIIYLLGRLYMRVFGDYDEGSYTL